MFREPEWLLTACAIVRVPKFKNPRDITNICGCVRENQKLSGQHWTSNEDNVRKEEGNTYNCDNVPNSWLKHSTVFTIRRA